MVFQDKAMMNEPMDTPEEQFMKSITLNDELEGTSDLNISLPSEMQQENSESMNKTSNESDKTSEETILEYMMKTNVDGNSKVYTYCFI